MRLFLLAAFLLPCAGVAVEYHEPKPGSPERVAIMEAMRRPVSKQVSKRVKFTGEVRVSGAWAAFHGHVAPADGKPPTGDLAVELEFDFFALLRRDDDGWKTLHWGFAGDIGVAEEARQKYPKAPKVLYPYLDGQ